MASRTKPTTEIETRVLVESRRRCCLCAFLDRDWEEKAIQIAHVDRDASNSTYENLAALCLKHHDLYDSRRSQSKGYTPGELRAYRARLVQAYDVWADVPGRLIDAPVVRGAAQEADPHAQDLLGTGAALTDSPKMVVHRRDGERAGNELLRLSRQGWLDPSIDNVGEISVLVVGEAPEDRDRQLLIVGNSDATLWQVGLFERQGARWLCVFNMLSANFGGPPPLRVVPGDVHVAIEVDRELMRGTGVLNRSTCWYRASATGPRVLIEYPQAAWVSGWCGFDRQISVEATESPVRLQHGATLGLVVRVEYSGDLLTGREVPLFAMQQQVTLRWDDEGGIFIPIGTSAAALANAKDWFDDGDEQFLERHFAAIAAVARTGSLEQREWLRRFLLRCHVSAAAAELRRIQRESSDEPPAERTTA